MNESKKDFEFGTLEFQDVEGLFSYNCMLQLPISKQEVMVCFETDSRETFPTLPQKQFIKHLVDNYNEVLKAIALQLPIETETFGLEKTTFLQEKFDLYTVGISQNIQNDQEWNLSLKNRTKKSLSVLANFKEMTPYKIWVEKESKVQWLLRILNAIGLR